MSYILDALKKADAERDQGAVPGLHSRHDLPPSDDDDDDAPRKLPPMLWVGAGIAATLLVVLGWQWWQRPSWHGMGPGGGPMMGEGPAGQMGSAEQMGPEGQMGAAGQMPAGQTMSPGQGRMAAGQVMPGDAQGRRGPPSDRAMDRPMDRATGVASDRMTDRGPARFAERADARSEDRREPVRPREAPRAVPQTQAPEPRTAPATPVTREAPATATAPRPAAAPPQAVAANPGAPDIHALPDSVRRELPNLTIGGAMYSDTRANRMLVINSLVFHEGDQPSPGLTLEEIRLKSAIFNYRGTRYSVNY